MIGGARLARPPWCVEVTYEDQDPLVFGPYTELQAKRVSARLMEEVALATDSSGINHHPHDVRHAGPFPLARYEDFLTTQGRRGARANAAAADRAAAERSGEL